MDLFSPNFCLSGPGDACPVAAEPELLELTMLLPAWQVEALDLLARRNGQSVGQLLRRMIANLVAAPNQSITA